MEQVIVVNLDANSGRASVFLMEVPFITTCPGSGLLDLVDANILGGWADQEGSPNIARTAAEALKATGQDFTVISAPSMDTKAIMWWLSVETYQGNLQGKWAEEKKASDSACAIKPACICLQ